MAEKFNDVIPTELVDSLSQSEQAGIARIAGVRTSAQDYRDREIADMYKNLRLKLSEAKSNDAAIEESMRANLNNMLSIADLEDENIDKLMKKNIEPIIDMAAQLAVQTGNSPIMSNAEQIYYDAYSPAEAYKLINIDKMIEPNPIEGLPNGNAIDGESNPNINNDVRNPQYIPPIIENPIVPPPPPITTPSPPPPPLVDGEKWCYIHAKNNDGGITSIPVSINVNRACSDLGYFDSPYVPPPPPPTLPPTPSNPTVIGSHTVGDIVVLPDGQYVVTDLSAFDCAAFGGKLFTDYTNPSHPVQFCVTKIVSPPPPIVPPTNNPQDPSQPPFTKSLWCFPGVGPENPVHGEEDPPPPPCPPGCIRIDSVIGNQVSISSICGDWDNPAKVCDAWKHVTSQGTITPPELPPIQPISSATGLISGLEILAGNFVNIVGGIGMVIPNLFAGLFESGSISSIAIKEAISAGQTSIATGVSEHAAKCGGDGTAIAKVAAGLSVAAWMERLSGAPVGYIFKDELYSLQFQIPQTLPTQDEFDSIYLDGKLTENEWKCYTKALGNLPNTHHLNLESKRAKVGVRELVFLKRYKFITEERYKELMRGVGVLHSDDRQRIEDSMTALPSMQDIIHYMVRDAGDETAGGAVETQGLDLEFKEKFSDKLKLWTEAQGIPEDVMKYAWRSHWQNLPPTVIFQLLRRNRKGSVADDLVFTESDALKQLGIDDVAPNLRKLLISISYEVPTRTDLKRGYNIDALDETEVIDGLLDNGYTEENAWKILKIFDKDKEIYKQGIAGKRSSFTPKMISNYVADGSMTEREARNQLNKMYIPEDQQDRLLDSASLKSNVLTRKKCIAATKKQFMNGAYDFSQANSELNKWVQSSEKVNNLLEAWNCELQSSVKEVTASKNVSWFVAGIITFGELTRRLQNLHYSEQAISGWLSEAVIKARKQKEAQDKALQLAIEKQLKEQKKAEKERRDELIRLGIIP